ncbi:flagellar export chaperone FliS [Curvivirga aplysinae]|uniref:flagellar export chaperone FliS n=1 Tax=Curvivirga aplysinae TaxID=2529852 RepID=UPI0012BC010C|nr:flagellar protein FliS [Curvivirga aplysinae]MTI09721.1 hypothetical protein [Curvivirga aplysinae]
MYQAYANAINAYARASEAQTGVRAILRIYDRMYHRLYLAKEARLNGDFETEFNSVEVVLKALIGLRSNLNFKQGGKVALTLKEYYTNLISQINYRYKAADKIEHYDNILQQVNVMRSAWAALAGEPSSQSLQREEEHVRA